jgi:hypothetical protein
MGLNFPGQWRFSDPAGVQPIDHNAVHEFYGLIERIAAQGERWPVLETFKGAFAPAIGLAHYRSSSESWAETDLRNYMEQAAHNPPLFLEAFYDATETIRQQGGYDTPDLRLVNKLCREHNIPFEIDPPKLNAISSGQQAIPVPPAPATLEETAAQTLHESVIRSEQLIAEGHFREAVQEMLWVLESLSTGFRGVLLPTGEVRGKYFNQIANELKSANPGTTLSRALEWCEQLHGYLSSPTGGGVRHGADLKGALAITENEARLFCNLIRTYVWFLQSEHGRLRSS